MRWKVMLCSALFLLLTAVKLAMPTHAEELRTQLLKAIDMDFDYRAAAVRAGEYISDPELAGRAVKALLSLADPDTEGEPAAAEPESDVSRDPETAARPASLSSCREEIRRRALIDGAAALISPEDIALREERLAEEAAWQRRREEVVTAFTEAQSAYGQTAPAGVSYDMPYLDLAYCLPVSGSLSSGFGYRIHPISGVLKFHYGLDIGASEGADIVSFAAGTVKTAAEDSSYGKYVVLEHGDGCETLYAHCSSLLVSPGDRVEMGDLIARVGQTGAATGPHLHFEIRLNDECLNPAYYVSYV